MPKARRQGRGPRRENKALERARHRPVPGRDRIAGDEARLPGPKTTTDDPDVASVVYSTEIDFPSNGEWRWRR